MKDEIKLCQKDKIRYLQKSGGNVQGLLEEETRVLDQNLNGPVATSDEHHSSSEERRLTDHRREREDQHLNVAHAFARRLLEAFRQRLREVERDRLLGVEQSHSRVELRDCSLVQRFISVIAILFSARPVPVAELGVGVHPPQERVAKPAIRELSADIVDQAIDFLVFHARVLSGVERQQIVHADLLEWDS